MSWLILVAFVERYEEGAHKQIGSAERHTPSSPTEALGWFDAFVSAGLGTGIDPFRIERQNGTHGTDMD